MTLSPDVTPTLGSKHRSCPAELNRVAFTRCTRGCSISLWRCRWSRLDMNLCRAYKNPYIEQFSLYFSGLKRPGVSADNLGAPPPDIFTSLFPNLRLVPNGNEKRDCEADGGASSLNLLPERADYELLTAPDSNLVSGVAQQNSIPPGTRSWLQRNELCHDCNAVEMVIEKHVDSSSAGEWVQ